MSIIINHASDEPLYLQIRAQIIAAIAKEDLLPGDHLPGVRRLSADLGVNLHTVNKAYAILRDEGYVLMKTRSGAIVAPEPPALSNTPQKQAENFQKLSNQVRKLIQAHKAAGYDAQSFIDLVKREAKSTYETSDSESLD